MPSQLHEAALSALIEPDGRAAAARLLHLLIGSTGAKAGALFELQGSRPVLFCSADVAQETIDATTRAWEREREELKAGRMVERKDQVIAPLKVGSDLVALLAIRAPRSGSLPKALEALGPLFIEAIEAARNAERERPGEELRRLLEENEWNVARVARILGVSRVTVYARLTPRMRATQIGRAHV